MKNFMSDTRLVLLKLLFVEIYDRILNYVCDHQDLNGELLRAKIRKVFGTSLSAAQLDRLLALARTRCPNPLED